MAVKDEKKEYFTSGVNPNYDAGEKTKEEDYSGVAYDNTTDYMALMNEAQQRGDYTAAYNYERQRNAKIKGEGLDMPTTSTFARYNPETRYRYDPEDNAEYQEYRSQMRSLYDKIMGQGDFEYDAESDPLYQQYRTQYMRQGQQAMRDTMGQAAALTGGYGSTYAQQAGEQAYETYLGRLKDVLPELYGAAYDRWRGERSDLMQGYQLAKAGADAAYDRGYSDWSTQLGLERADEQTAYERRKAAEETEYTRGQNERSHLESLILTTGYIPSAAELQAAGMTQAQADSLRNQYLFNQQMSFNSGSGGGRSGSSGGGRRRSSGSGSGGTTPTVQPSTSSGSFWSNASGGLFGKEKPEKEEPSASEMYEQKRNEIAAMMNRGASVAVVRDAIKAALKNGEITYTMYTQLMLMNNSRGGGVFGFGGK